jgi:hypothetical protein
MPHGSQPNRGRYTTAFTSIAAGDVHVPGLPPASAGTRNVPGPGFSTYPATFTVGPDVAALVQYTRRFIPTRPANLREDLLPDLLAAD